MRALSAAALIWGAMLMAGPALAQDPAAPAAEPATGPATTGSIGTTAPATGPQRIGALTRVGQTKPPGSALGDDLGTRPDLLARSREIDRRINVGICSGCQ
jgi:hypothetical protein